jgi:hypothetical protein
MMGLTKAEFLHYKSLDEWHAEQQLRKAANALAAKLAREANKKRREGERDTERIDG